jgi:GTP-binding protein HflX
VLIYDTIGFIRDLPPELIDAFSSTLEESLSCDILLEVVDASDLHWEHRIDVTNAILDRIGAAQPRIYIFNQIDRVSPKELKVLKKITQEYVPIFVSAKT